MATFFSPEAILNHLFEYLPRVTDRFSDNALVSAEIVAGTPQVLRVTDVSHGLDAGSQVVLIDGKIDNDITAVELIVDTAGDVLRFTTGQEHDLTLDYTLTVELSGFTDSAFNGTFDLVAVPSRNIFEISGDSLPVLNGNEVLREDWEIGINDLFIVTRKISDDIYEIDLTGKPEFTPQTVPTLKRASQFRMGINIDAKRAESLYTPQPDTTELWLFVIMGDSAASKDSNITSDAIQTNTAQNPSRILMINTFTLLVFFPTDKETSGGAASNLAWDEILKVMLLVASGIRFDDFGNTLFTSTLIEHGTAVYKNSYYSHAYTFEYNYEVTQEESFITQFIESRAFRDNTISLSEIDEGSNIDMDEEPT